MGNPPTETARHREPPRSRWRIVGASVIVAAGFLLVAVAITLGVSKAKPGGKDFIEYWAAEQGLVKGGNAYDRTAVLHLETAEGFAKPRPEFWYSPPPALVVALPLGYLSAKAGLIAWTLLHFCCLSVALWMLWQLHGRPDTLVHLLGYLFAPVILCLEAGQISIFFLLSIVLFLYFVRKSSMFLAGAALFPCLLKPHLFLVFGVVLLLWIVRRSAHAMIAGFATALGIGTAVVLAFDPQIWSHYRQMMRTEGMLGEYVATLSVSLRFALDRQAIWLQFVPAVLAGCWAIVYFAKKRAQWNWMNHGLLVLLVSVMCAPYGWFFDESVLLPAMLTALLRARENGRALWPIGVVAAAALIEVNREVNVMSAAYLWTTPAWLACYLYASRRNPFAAPAPNARDAQQTLGATEEMERAAPASHQALTGR